MPFHRFCSHCFKDCFYYEEINVVCHMNYYLGEFVNTGCLTNQIFIFILFHSYRWTAPPPVRTCRAAPRAAAARSSISATAAPPITVLCRRVGAGRAARRWCSPTAWGGACPSRHRPPPGAAATTSSISSWAAPSAVLLGSSPGYRIEENI